METYKYFSGDRDRKNVVGSTRNMARIPANKTAPFAKLWARICHHYGGEQKTGRALKISNSSLRLQLNQKKLTEHYANIILTEYNRLKALGVFNAQE